MRCAGNSGDVRGKITKIQAVLITSPTYEGVVSDIRAIADAAHEYVHLPGERYVPYRRRAVSDLSYGSGDYGRQTCDHSYTGYR